jgi:hypothetical protein
VEVRQSGRGARQAHQPEGKQKSHKKYNNRKNKIAVEEILINSNKKTEINFPYEE